MESQTENDMEVGFWERWGKVLPLSLSLPLSPLEDSSRHGLGFRAQGFAQTLRGDRFCKCRVKGATFPALAVTNPIGNLSKYFVCGFLASNVNPSVVRGCAQDGFSCSPSHRHRQVDASIAISLDSSKPNLNPKHQIRNPTP